jgi:hypothetical protein
VGPQSRREASSMENDDQRGTPRRSSCCLDGVRQAGISGSPEGVRCKRDLMVQARIEWLSSDVKRAAVAGLNVKEW